MTVIPASYANDPDQLFRFHAHVPQRGGIDLRNKFDRTHCWNQLGETVITEERSAEYVHGHDDRGPLDDMGAQRPLDLHTGPTKTPDKIREWSGRPRSCSTRSTAIATRDW
jgi:hypothetical protein